VGALHDRASGTHAPVVPAAPWSVADTLSDVLQTVRLTGALFFLVDARSPWVAEAPASHVLSPVLLPQAQHVVSYHVIRHGACWCESPGLEPLPLAAGDVLVVPHGHEYALTSQPGLRTGYSAAETLRWFEDMAAGRLPFVVQEGGAGPERIDVVCGFLGCDALPFNPVLATLPPLLRIRLPAAGTGDRLETLLGYAVAESKGRSAGSQSVLLRIAELVFVEVLRAHLVAAGEEASGWLNGLRDPLVGQVLARLHAAPAEAWTLERLAHDVGASRTVLSDRFTQFVGLAPMLYLTRWRLQLAARRLLEPGAKVAGVAWEVGYESEAAFSRAFKRCTGVSPMTWRRGKRGL
jgi:AraC-like DNA-binding protein